MAKSGLVMWSMIAIVFASSCSSFAAESTHLNGAPSPSLQSRSALTEISGSIAFGEVEVFSDEVIVNLGLSGRFEIVDGCLRIISDESYVAAFNVSANASVNADAVILGGVIFPIGDSLEFSGTRGAPHLGVLTVPDSCGSGPAFYVDAIAPGFAPVS